MSNLHFSSELVAQRGLDIRTEAICVDEKRRDNQNQQNYHDNDCCDDERFLFTGHGWPFLLRVHTVMGELLPVRQDPYVRPLMAHPATVHVKARSMPTCKNYASVPPAMMPLQPPL